MANILFAYADASRRELNTSYWRCFIPADALIAAGHSCPVRHIGELFSPGVPEETKRDIDEADVIVLERLLLRGFHDTIRHWRMLGKAVFCTFDDNYALMPPGDSISRMTWMGGKESRNFGDELLDKYGVTPKLELLHKIINEFRQGLRLVNGAFVPSRVLADDYRPYCSNIQYVPNCPSVSMWEGVKPRPRDGNVIIGWGGSSAHNISWRDSGLPAALGNICRRYPRVHVKIYGLSDDIRAMLDRFKVRYTGSGWVEFDRWPHEVASWNIYVAPVSGEYDLRRSNIKALEAGMAGIPWVASNIGVYDEAQGGTLVKNRSADWERALSELVEDETLRRTMGHQGSLWATKMAEGCAKVYEEALGI